MRHTVLVIDDQWSMQELARIVLQSAGYHVLSASDTITGLCLARTEHPDVTVLDENLCEFDGGFLHGLRENPHTAKMPVILISTSDHGIPPADPPGTHCLQKPFRPPELLALVDGLLYQEDMPIAI